MRDQYLITVTAIVVSSRTAAMHSVSVTVELIIGHLGVSGPAKCGGASSL
jgi:hypothetical protein